MLRAMVLFGGPLSVSQITADTGMTPAGVRLALGTLSGLQIVSVLGRAKSQLYEVNAKHPLASALHQLFTEERSNWDRLLDSLRRTLKRFGNVEAAWYYGSIARGDDHPASDFDIAVIVSKGSIDDAVDSVRDALQPVGDTAGVSFSVVGVASKDVQSMSDESGWWNSMAKDAVALKGLAPDRLVATIKRKPSA